MSTSYLWYLGWLATTAVGAVAVAMAAPHLSGTMIILGIGLSPVIGLASVIGLGLVRFVERSYDLRPAVAGTVAYVATAAAVAAVIVWVLKIQ
ncbi:hypothetical protein OG474_04570 [Kribbella sp. NBC_01505]|uniref:hypothetical protein n=1 Tax=Kribbella sp. NBC_01505 TaxID=2903580 RepID=UPI0038677E84